MGVDGKMKLRKFGRQSDGSVGRVDQESFGVFQWNARHLKDVHESGIEAMAEELKLDVIGICEVHDVGAPCRPGRIGGFEHPYTLQVDGSKGLAMYMREDLIWKSFESIELVAKPFWPQILTQGVGVYRPDGRGEVNE